jgi:NADH-quinone oxidoreductase subunit M
MFGRLDKEVNKALKDLNFREILTLLPLTLLAFWIGLYPIPFFKILKEPVEKLVQQVSIVEVVEEPAAEVESHH